MAEKKQKFISKGKYIIGRQCLKLLWYHFNDKAALPELGEDTKSLFEEGQKVGAYARMRFPEGKLLERLEDPEKMHESSMQAIKERIPLFESGMIYRNSYALPDILVPVGKNEWDLYEVKMAGSIKENHTYDVAYQKYIYEGAGLKLRKCYLMHADTSYVRKGDIDPEKLLIAEDLTKEAGLVSKGIEKEVEKMLDAINGPMPEEKIGLQCLDNDEGRYECPLKDKCWGFLPKESIFTYRGIRKKTCFPLLGKGIMKMEDMPEDKLNETQLMQKEYHGKKEVYVDNPALKNFLKELNYPIYMLDFETISPVIPAYDNTKPYEKIPFQFSLHTIAKKGATPDHFAYLSKTGDKNPEPEVLKLLMEQLGEKGTILAFHSSFEEGVIKGLVAKYKGDESWLNNNILKRINDLEIPFRQFMYYDPKQMGKSSIKKVLPALTGRTYNDLEIDNGGKAMREYYRVTFGKNIDPADRQQVYKDLEEYCEQDTHGMVDILKVLQSKAGRS